MPDARLNRSKLSDALVGVVDNVRRTIHGALGTRPYKVEIVKRTWSGGRRGVGHAVETVLELDPHPRVERVSKDRMGPAGREAEGTVVLSEVSLSYTIDELQPSVDVNEEVGYRLTELHGQRQPPRYYVLSATPVPRRGDKEGDRTDWYLLLNETSDMGPLDGVDA